MKKKGFTLIELLAVIVILAIIALIATPIVLNIIKDSKEQSRIRSLEMYIDAVGNAVVQYQLKTAKQPNRFEDIKEYITLDNNNVSCDGGEFKNGQIPLQDCKVENEIVIEDFIYGNVCVAVNENTATYRTDDTTKTVGYIASNVPNTAPLYNASEPQYTPGVEYICEVKKETYYRFFVLSVEGDNVNLIMDSGISLDGKAMKVSGLNTTVIHWGEKTKGPTDALEFLHNATKDWDNITNINIDYVDEGGRYGGLKTTDNITTIFDLNGQETATFTNLKSRLPKKIELSNLGCTEEEGSCPLYLYNYMSISDRYGGNNIDTISQYDTLSTTECDNYYIENLGKLTYTHTGRPGECPANLGAYFYSSQQRPVITLPKSLLSY